MNRVFEWVARGTSVAVVLLLAAMATGEGGGGPSGPREWAYLALFPGGFALGYLAAWRWPLAGGAFSLCCMVLSQLVMGRTYDLQAYVVWGVLCLPAVLFVLVGLREREGAREEAGVELE